MTPPNSPAPESKPPRVALWIATGFGLGYLPKAPGTWGSLGGVVVATASFLSLVASWMEPTGFFTRRSFQLTFWKIYLDSFSYFLLAVGIAWVGVWASQLAHLHFRKKDPQNVVIDEISGQFLTFLPARFDWQFLLAGFLLFRVFDIWKPWPARAAEKLPGGWGIMADDWVAGIYAALCLWGLRWLGL